MEVASAFVIANSVLTGYKIGKGIGKIIGNIVRDKTLTLINKHRHKIWVVVMYQNNYIDDWMVKGWFGVNYLHSFTYSFHGVKNRNVYYYANCGECESSWGKGEATGYVPTDNEAFKNFNSIGIGKLRNFSHVYLDHDVEIELKGY